MAGILTGSNRRYTPPQPLIPQREPDRKFDDWTNPFGIALDIISTPGDLVKSGLAQGANALRGREGDGFAEDFSTGVGFGTDILDVLWRPPENKMGWRDPQRWARTALGLAGEIVSDPLSYIGAPGAGVLNAGGAKRVAAAASEPGAYIAKALQLGRGMRDDLDGIAARFRAANDDYDAAIRGFNVDRLDTAAAETAATARRRRDETMRALIDELPPALRERMDTTIQQLARTGGGAAAVTDEVAAEVFGISTGLRLRPAFLPTRRGVQGGPQILSQAAWSKITAPVRGIRGEIAKTSGWQRLANKFGKAQNAGLRELINGAESLSPEMMRLLLAARSQELNIQAHIQQFTTRYNAMSAALLADLPTSQNSMDAVWEAMQTPDGQWDDALLGRLQSAGLKESQIDGLREWYRQVDNEMRAVGAEHGWLGDVYIPWRMAQVQKEAGGRAAAKMPLELTRRIRPEYMGTEVTTVSKALAGADPVAKLNDDGTLFLLKPNEFDQAGYLREINEIGRNRLGEDFVPPELIKNQSELASLYVWEAAHTIGNRMRQDMLVNTGLARTVAAVNAAEQAGKALSNVQSLMGKKAKVLDDIRAETENMADLSARVDELEAVGLPAQALIDEAAESREFAISQIHRLLNNRNLPSQHRQPLKTALNALRADRRRTRPFDVERLSDARTEALGNLSATFDDAYRAATDAATVGVTVDQASIDATRAASTEFAAASDSMSDFAARVDAALEQLDSTADAAQLMARASDIIDEVTERTGRWLTAADALKEANPSAYTAIRQSAAAYERRLLNYQASLRARYAAVSTQLAYEINGAGVAGRAASQAERDALAGYSSKLRELNQRRAELQLEHSRAENQLRSLARSAAEEQSERVFENVGQIFGLTHRGRQLIPVEQLVVDAATFQVKTSMNAEGVVRGSIGDPRVKAERWNPLGSTGVVWRRLDGSYQVIDGHQRTAFGKRLLAENPGAATKDGQPLMLPAYVLEEADGWGQAEAYMAGTVKNVIEGSVSPFDYAAFLRSVQASGVISNRADEIIGETAASIGSGSELLQNAARLNRLSDAAFELARRLQENPQALSQTDRAVPNVLLRGVTYGGDPRKAGGPEWWISHVGGHIDEPAHHADVAASLWANLLENVEMRTLPAVSEWLRARNDLLNGTVARLRQDGVEIAGTQSLFEGLGDEQLEAFRLSEDILDVRQMLEQQITASLKAAGKSERMATAVQNYVVANSDATDEGYAAIVQAAERLRMMELPDLFVAANRMGIESIPQIDDVIGTATRLANTPAMADSRTLDRAARGPQFARVKKEAKTEAARIAREFRAHIEGMLDENADTENIRSLILRYAEDVNERETARLTAEKEDARKLVMADNEPVSTQANDRLAEALKDDNADTLVEPEQPTSAAVRERLDREQGLIEPEVEPTMGPGAGQTDIFGGMAEPEPPDDDLLGIDFTPGRMAFDVNAQVDELRMFGPEPVRHAPAVEQSINQAEELLADRFSKQSARRKFESKLDEPGAQRTSADIWRRYYDELGLENDRLRKEMDKLSVSLEDASVADEANALFDRFLDARRALIEAEDAATEGMTPATRGIAAQAWSESQEGQQLADDAAQLYDQWVLKQRAVRYERQAGVADEQTRRRAAEISQLRQAIVEQRARMDATQSRLFGAGTPSVEDAALLEQQARSAVEVVSLAAAGEQATHREALQALDAEPLPGQQALRERPSAETDDAGEMFDVMRELRQTGPVGTLVTVDEARIVDPAQAAYRTSLLAERELLLPELAAARDGYEAAREAWALAAVRSQADIGRTPAAISDDLLSWVKRSGNGKSWVALSVAARPGAMPTDQARFLARLPEELRPQAEQVLDLAGRVQRLWREAHSPATYLREQPLAPKPQAEMNVDERLAAITADSPELPEPDTLADVVPQLDTSGSSELLTARSRYAQQQQDAATTRTLESPSRDGEGAVARAEDPPADDIAAMRQAMDDAARQLDQVNADIDGLLEAGPNVDTLPGTSSGIVATQEELAGRIRGAVAVGSRERAEFERLLANFAPAATRYANLPAGAAANVDLAQKRIAELEQALPNLTGDKAIRARTEIRLMRDAEAQAQAIMEATPVDADPELMRRFGEAALIAYNSEIARAHTVRYSAARARLEELEDGEQVLNAGIETMAQEAETLLRLGEDTRVRSAIMHETVAGAKQWRDVMTSADIADVFETADRAANLRGWERHVRQTMKWWRGLALMSPGFHVRNGLSGMWSNWAAGVEVGDYAKVLPEYYRVVNNQPVGNAEVRQFIDDMMAAGVVGRGVYGTEIPESAGISRSINPFAGIRDSQRQFFGVTASRTVGNHVEHGLRLSIAYAAMRKQPELAQAGLAARTAAAKAAVDQWHFDYTNLSHMEQRLRDYVIPFWTWQSRNIPLMMSVFASRPQAVLGVEKLFESIGFGQPTNPFTPEWYDKQRYRQINDEWFLALDIPYISAIAETDRLGDSLSSPSGIVTTAVNFNPWLRSAIELVTGRDAARGYELAGSEKWRRTLSGTIPPLSQAQRLLPERIPGATTGMKERVLSSRLAYLGLPIRHLTQYDQQLAYVRQSRM